MKFERTLCRRNREAPHDQATQFARTYLEAARKWNVFPVLSHGAMDGDEPQHIRDGKASITVNIIHSHDAPGGNVVARKQIAWHFEVIQDNGWRVCAVQPPDVCRDLIICAGPESVKPSATPSAKRGPAGPF